MNARCAAVLTAVAGLASAAPAQVIISTPGITARLDLAWQEDPLYPHNDNGVLESGEHALILTSASFTGQFTRVHFIPTIGAFTDGLILGLCDANFDIRSLEGDAAGLYNGGITNPPSSSVGPNANNAGTSGYGVRGGWLVSGHTYNGNPVANGFANIFPGQFPADPSQCNTDNPITNIERLGWAPSSYSTRTQTFHALPAAGTSVQVGLYLDLDGSVGNPGTVGGIVYITQASVTFGSVDIPIVPGPAGLPLLGMGALAAGCRRRRSGALAEASR